MLDHSNHAPTAPDQPNVEVVTSIRYDEKLGASGLYLPAQHYRRLLRSFATMGWSTEDEAWLQSEETLVDFITVEVIGFQKRNGTRKEQPLKVRLAKSVLREPHITASLIPSLPIELFNPPSLSHFDDPAFVKQLEGCPHWTIYKDTERVAPDLPYSNLKSSYRELYDSARIRAGLASYSDPIDVLLVSRDGNIMETSISTFYVKRNNTWITPTLNTGCQDGTTRRMALEQGLCIEEDISADQLSDCFCVVSNGVRGFAPGRLVEIRPSQ